MEFASVYLHEEGVGLQSVGRHLEAIAKFDGSIQASPSPDTYNARAKSLLELGRFAEALDDLNAAISLDSDFAFAYWGRGVLNERLGKFDEALQDLNKAIRIDSENSGIYISRGYLYCFSLNNYEMSVADFSKANELEPDIWSHFAHRALAHFLSGDYQSAVNDNTAALERMNSETDITDRARVHFARSKSYEYLGELANSRADYARAKELDPSVLR